MTNYEEIKKLLSASRKLLGGNQLTEDIKNIKKNYGLLIEQPVEDTDNKIDVMTDIEDKIQNDKYETAEKDEDEDEYKEFDKVKSDKKKAYRISGGILVIHSKNTTDLQLTTDDKSAFQESMDDMG